MVQWYSKKKPTARQETEVQEQARDNYIGTIAGESHTKTSIKDWFLAVLQFKW